MLKKEFKRKDVDRARNLLMGKSGASSETQVGYKKKRIEYKEGDVLQSKKKTIHCQLLINSYIQFLDLHFLKPCLFHQLLNLVYQFANYQNQLLIINMIHLEDLSPI